MFFFAEAFTDKLADFQMTEILQFIIASLPTSTQSYDETIDEAEFVVVVAPYHRPCSRGHSF